MRRATIARRRPQARRAGGGGAPPVWWPLAATVVAMARHQQNERRDVLAGLAVDDANALIDRLARAGIRASAFAPGAIASNLFPTTDEGIQIIVAPEDREAALRIAAEAAGEREAAGREAAAGAGLHGPAIPGIETHANVNGQQDVDALLSGLGM